MTEGHSILDGLVAATMETKTKAATRLTPLPPEQPRPVTGQVPIPNHPLGSFADDPDIILGRLRFARSETEAILESIQRLEVLWGQPGEAEAQKVALDATMAAREKERLAKDQAIVDSVGPTASKADKAKAEAAQQRLNKQAAVLEALGGETSTEEFTAHMARLTADAQAQVFTEPSGAAVALAEDMGADEGDAANGWTCPDHGKAVIKTSPRRGRQYRACPEDGCTQFERL